MFVLNILGFFCVFDKSRNLKEKKLHKSILRLPFLKHTHTQKKMIEIIIKGSTNLPLWRKKNLTTPQMEVPTTAVKE